MTTFRDALGREWSVEVDIPARRAVREATGGRVDLFAVFEGDLGRQVAEPETLGTVLFTLCEAQAAKAGVNADAFARGLRGDALDAATAAVFEAIAEFLPAAQARLLRAAMQRGRADMDAAVAGVLADLAEPPAEPAVGPQATPGEDAATAALPERRDGQQ